MKKCIILVRKQQKYKIQNWFTRTNLNYKYLLSQYSAWMIDNFLDISKGLFVWWIQIMIQTNRSTAPNECMRSWIHGSVGGWLVADVNNTKYPSIAHLLSNRQLKSIWTIYKLHIAASKCCNKSQRCTTNTQNLTDIGDRHLWSAEIPPLGYGRVDPTHQPNDLDQTNG